MTFALHRIVFFYNRILTLGEFSDAPVSAYGSLPTAGSFWTPDEYSALGTGQSSPGLALAGLALAAAPQNPNAPTESWEKRECEIKRELESMKISIHI